MYNDMEIILKSTGALIYVIDLATYEILYVNNISEEEFGDVIGKTCYKVLQKNQDFPCGFCPLQQQDINPLLLPIGTVYSWENENSINHKHYLFTDRIIQWSDKRKVKVQIGIDITNKNS